MLKISFTYWNGEDLGNISKTSKEILVENLFHFKVHLELVLISGDDGVDVLEFKITEILGIHVSEGLDNNEDVGDSVLGVEDSSDLLDLSVGVSSVSSGDSGVDDLAINDLEFIFSSDFPDCSYAISLLVFTDDGLIGLGLVLGIFNSVVTMVNGAFMVFNVGFLIPIILGGDSGFRNYGLTHDVESKESYQEDGYQLHLDYYFMVVRLKFEISDISKFFF